MKYLSLTIFCIFLLPKLIVSQDQLNMSLFAQFNRGDVRYSGSWAYIDLKNRKEYALLGTRTGTAIYTIDIPEVEEIGFIPGPESNWREITVRGDFAYITTEGSGIGEGMQIINLSNLPNEAKLVNTYNATFTKAHIIQSDIYNEQPIVYVMGVCNTCGVNILDVSDPINPVEIGNYGPGYYIHDAHIRGDYLYAAAFYKGLIDIINIKDKSNPVLVAQIEVPGGNTHSTWTTEDAKHLIISPEKDGLPARIWNIEDLENMYEVANYSGNLASLTHNPYVRGQYIFFSHNTEGIRVVDIKDPSVPVEVGYYDTFDGPSGGFNGLWSACPYFPSGKIIGGNREDGLFVWNFNNAKAGRFYARVKDATTQEPVLDPTFLIQKLDTFLSPDLAGIYKFGSLSGNFKIELSAEGYETQELDIVLNPGDSLSLEILLQPKSVGFFEVEPHFPNLSIAPNPIIAFTVVDLTDFKNAQLLRVYNRFGQLVQTERVEGAQYFLLERGTISTGVHFFAIYNKHNQMLANGKVIFLD